MKYPFDGVINNRVDLQAQKLWEQDPMLCKKLADVVRDGDTRTFSDAEIDTLVKASFLQKGVKVRAVVQSTMESILRGMLQVPVANFTRPGGWIEMANEEYPDLMDELVRRIYSDAPLDETFAPLEELNIVFRRLSDGQLSVDQVVRTRIAYDSFDLIRDIRES